MPTAGNTSCCHCKQRDRRPGQNDCRACHAASVKVSRKRKNDRLAALEAAVLRVSADDPEARMAFDAAFPNRFILVVSLPGDVFEDFAGFVIGFKPGMCAMVAHESGRVYGVPLQQLRRDPNFK